MFKIVIVGGGAGGLELAAKLGKKLGKKKSAEIVLIDQNRSHIWKPLLHEVATGTLDSSTDGVVYHAHAAKHYYQFCLGRFTGLDPQAKTLTVAANYADDGLQLLPKREISYDLLVLAIGSQSNDFGTAGVKQHCHFLDSPKQAEKFHHALLNQFLRINQSESPNERLSVSIVGAGATGVELSAELFNVSALVKAYNMPNMSADKLEINLIEAGPRILAALPERISYAARKELSNLGVNVRENTRVKEATAEGYITSDDELIKADLMIWAAGIKVPDYIKELAVFELNHLNQIIVKPTLQASISDDIYVLGDCCGFQHPDGSWVPPRAQSAHQMADTVRANIYATLQRNELQSFKYKDYGSLVSLSRFGAVGNLMGNLTKKSMFIEGHLARIMYISLYRMHQFAIHGWAKAILVIVAEKIAKVVRPKMKLH
ncbi:MAG: NAD(P)/FAD-dependent oxidoreductase [Oceanospirillaceae bacterium]|nr:NAD(P)/FAD-dependent oxidoreductase [Oceanospirillaceae bacterium]